MLMCFVLEIIKEIETQRRLVAHWVMERWEKGDPIVPPLKTFKPKYNLPVLNSYRGSADERYWNYWPKVTWETSRGIKSCINPGKLKQMAIDIRVFWIGTYYKKFAMTLLGGQTLVVLRNL